MELNIQTAPYFSEWHRTCHKSTRRLVYFYLRQRGHVTVAFLCLSVSKTWKVLNSFESIFLKILILGQGKGAYISVMFHILEWIWPLIFSTILGHYNTCVSHSIWENELLGWDLCAVRDFLVLVTWYPAALSQIQLHFRCIVYGLFLSVGIFFYFLNAL